MRKLLDQRGELNVLAVPVILLALLLMSAAGFAFWAYGQRQDYKNNSDQKVSVAVSANTKSVQATDAKDYAEKAKNPLAIYSGPDAYGSVKLSYPKTWSTYVDLSNTSYPLDVYFNQAYVPSVNSKQTYMLRVRVSSQDYSSLLQQFNGQVTSGDIKVAPYSLPKVSGVMGSILTGDILPGSTDVQGTMVMLPLRDKTLMIWTESPSYLNDFNTYILSNLTFSP